ncbi:MAG: DedA family protein [Reyranella sp.]|jgi:membrane protein DedA with SNARE-associated domain|nr:DedA family protein [Reyranella sp.]
MLVGDERRDVENESAQRGNWGSMFVVAFGESLAFVSLLFPGTALLIAAGVLTPGEVLPVASLVTGAVLGAIAGDAVSFWIGRRFGHALNQAWPFNRHPELIPSGIAFFERHGGKSVFIGRFFGPVRATIPLVAGILKMPTRRFWIANVGSAVVWVPGVMFPGALAGTLVKRFALGMGVVPLAAAFFVAAGIVAIWIVLSRRATH